MKILVLRTFGRGGFPDVINHHKLWDIHNMVDYGIADYYNGIENPTYEYIKKYNQGQNIELKSDDIGLMIGIYGKHYYKRKNDNPITETEFYPSLLKPTEQDFI